MQRCQHPEPGAEVIRVGLLLGLPLRGAGALPGRGALPTAHVAGALGVLRGGRGGETRPKGKSTVTVMTPAARGSDVSRVVTRGEKAGPAAWSAAGSAAEEG